LSDELLWTTLAGLVMVVGLCGVAIPLLPGLGLVWAAALVYGFAVGWGPGGVTVMIVLTALLGVSVAKSVVVPRRAATGGGASGRAQVGGLFGAVAGFFLIPVVGVIIGALAGLLVTELLIKRDWAEAWTATKATAKGFGLSTLIDLGLGLVMILVWSVWAAAVVL
jgi:uncharacterized protein YqgC (DUF456 family)